MARIDPLPRAELAHYEPIFQLIETNMGFVPASLPTMARIPALFETFGTFASTVMNAGLIDRGLVQFIAHVASTAAGCQYCQAHTAAHAHHLGVDADKIANVWTFETDPRFTDAERAALRLARDAAQVPNLATDDHFTELARHYDDAQVVQIVGVISLFGYLNRWNDTMATTLEPEPLEFANQHLTKRGWHPGKHQPDPAS
jgi:uncharacterized peroxidase-related enzyme